MPTASSGLHSVDPTVGFDRRLYFLDAEGRKPANQWARRRSFELLEARAGARILDVGCGAGNDARELAPLLQPGGRLVSIDIEPRMIEEARRRSAGLPIDFRVSDVYQLEDADGTYHGCRAERMFLHLAEPQRALVQMARVVVPGGRVVVVERDIETRTIDAPDRLLTRRILNFWCDQFLGGWIGRRLARLFREAGLRDVRVDSVTAIDTDFAEFDEQYDLARIAARAAEAGVITADDAARWYASIQAQAAAGSFFSSMTLFVTGGSKA